MHAKEDHIDVLCHAAVEPVKAVDFMKDWLCIIEELDPPMLVSELDTTVSV